MTTVKGREITTSHTVHISYSADERTGQFIWPELTTDDWGDPAVVVEVEPQGDGTIKLTVAPDHTDTLEYVEADSDTEYEVKETGK